MMDTRCESCKWWATWDADNHICVLLSELWDDNDDLTPEDIKKREMVQSRDVLQIGGSPIYTSVLITSAEFGCNQWECKT